MARTIRNEYTPDRVTPPGETLRETIQALGMSQTELARRTGKAPKTINEIIQGKAPITPATALQFERVLGAPARFWNNRERDYKEFLARSKETDRLRGSTGWLDRFPVSEMVGNGYIRRTPEPLDQLRELLSFFGVSSEKQWQKVWLAPAAAFRKSAVFADDPYSTSAWLQAGKIAAQKVTTAQFDRHRFREALACARKQTAKPPAEFTPVLRDSCANAGVAVIFTRELPHAPISGATQWLSPDKALLQLSLRYKTNDHLWFTFFHEACHILHHSKKAVFLESGQSCDGKEEEQADRFASDTLIPPDMWRSFLTSGRKTRDAIDDFARGVGIAPGIVVGRLQHEERLPWRTRLNSLKVSLKWAPQ